MAHALRWFNQIKSYAAAESKAFPGVKDAAKYLSSAAAPTAADDDDSDVDLFGSSDDEEESAEAARVREERLKAAKSIEKEGLVWGAHKLVPVGYGINKLQLMCVVEDEKVSIDELQEQIAEFEDYVQSCDVASMSKI